MRRILIDAEVMRVAERYADVLTADKIVGWRERPIDRLRQIRDDLIEDCNYKLAIYTGCIINNYRYILLLPSEHFAELYSEFFYRWDDLDMDTKVRVKDGEKTFRDAILWAMRYEDVRDNILPDIMRELNINSCVYCNEVPITTTESYTNIHGKEVRDTRYQIDHYWPQSKYPYLSTSFFNFQPSCANCNNNKSVDNALFNLYTLDNEDRIINPFHFTFGSEDKILEAIIDQKWNKLDIRLKAPNDSLLEKNHQILFHIDAIYQTDMYKQEVYRIATKVFGVNDSYVQSLRDALPVITISDEAVKEDSFMDIGYYLHDNLVHYKPLNKLAIDVVRYMNL